MNNLIASLPFEIYELHLFHLIALHRSFTKAAAKAHITQSAITRQIQSMERKLGTPLFVRNTRTVSLTEAGSVLFARSASLLKEVENTVAEIEQVKEGRAQILRLGVCRSIGLSYLPGFFVGFRKKHPAVQVRIESESSPAIVAKILDGELKAGVIHSLPTLPRQITCAHRFNDDFTIIYPAKMSPELRFSTTGSLLETVPLLLPQPHSQARDLIEGWLRNAKLPFAPAMELDSFDLIVNLVSLGLGCSIVPHRTLPLYLQRPLIARVPCNPPLSRNLFVVTKKGLPREELVEAFVSEILF